MRRRPFIDATKFLGKVWGLARPYWFSEERWRARGLLAAVLALTLGLVYMAVLFNRWNREFYNSLEQKNFADFKDLLLYFSFLAAIYIAAAVYRLYLTQMLVMRWRESGSPGSTSANGWTSRSITGSSSRATAPTTRTSGSRRTCACSPTERSTSRWACSAPW